MTFAVYTAQGTFKVQAKNPSEARDAVCAKYNLQRGDVKKIKALRTVKERRA